MAKTGGVQGFWKVLKSVSIGEISREANRPLSVAIVGSKDSRTEATEALYRGFTAREESGEAITENGRLVAGQIVRHNMPESPFVQGFDDTSPESTFPQQSGVFDLVIDVGGGRVGAPDGVVIYSMQELGGWDGMLERILDDRPELGLALARNFPVFRQKVAQREIIRTATANAQWAVVTGLTDSLPPTAILLPVHGLSDLIVLTKNQTMLVLRLAAAYGLPIDYRSRMKELGPVIANGFGWRAIARELVGIVPIVGFLARATIAYAGTVTVGKAAQLYYETGETVSGVQLKRLYREAYESSRERVRSIAEALRRGRGGGGGRKASLAANQTGTGMPPLEAAPLGLEPGIEPIRFPEPGDSNEEVGRKSG